jgi:hypothetical protein
MTTQNSIVSILVRFARHLHWPARPEPGYQPHLHLRDPLVGAYDRPATHSDCHRTVDRTDAQADSGPTGAVFVGYYWVRRLAIAVIAIVAVRTRSLILAVGYLLRDLTRFPLLRMAFRSRIVISITYSVKKELQLAFFTRQPLDILPCC